MTINDYVMINGNFTLFGTSNIGGGTYNPYWFAGKVDDCTGGGAPTILRTKSWYPFTCVRNPNQTVGVYEVSRTTPHTDDSNYILMVHGEGGGWSELVNSSLAAIYGCTSNKFSLFFRKLYQGASVEALVDCLFIFSLSK